MIVVSDTTPLLSLLKIKREKFIAVKPVNNPESASILKRATGLD